VKKQLNRQAIFFSLILFLSWFSFAGFQFIFALGKTAFKYTAAEQMLVFVPTAIMIAATLALNYILKPDLSRHFRMHIGFGLVTILICTVLVISFIALPSWAEGRLHSNLALLHMNLYWIVPVVSLLMEVGCYIRQRLYKKPKELIVLLVSSASIGLLMTYIAELYVVGLSI